MEENAQMGSECQENMGSESPEMDANDFQSEDDDELGFIYNTYDFVTKKERENQGNEWTILMTWDN